MGTDCIGSCKYNFHAITTTTDPSDLLFCSLHMDLFNVHLTTTSINESSSYKKKSASGVIVGLLIWSKVDCGLEPLSDQTKDYKIDICCFSAIEHAV